MKFRAAFLAASLFLRGSTANSNKHLRRKLAQTKPCTLLIEVRHLEGQVDEENVVCQIDEENDQSIVSIGGFSKEELKDKVNKGEIISGETTMFSDGAEIIDKEIKADSAKTMFEKKDRTGNNRRNLAGISGTRTVLVVRVIAPDASTTQSKATLSDEIFGTSGDVFNLKSGYRQCSANQLFFEPTDDTRVTDLVSRPADRGVHEVTISTPVTGAADGTIRDAVTNALAAQWGSSWSSAFTHTMLCLPPGTTGSWIAYAYINWYLSVFNNEWCSYPSGNMHEIGHNLGLGHSNEGTTEYADQSGMMGYSYSQDEGPVMCFNGAKTYQVGWYAPYTTVVDPRTQPNWTGNLVGLAEYTAQPSELVVIKIETNPGGPSSSTSLDYYVNYNRKVGINYGTVEGGDQVMITTQGDGYSPSTLMAKLSAGASYTVAGFGGTSGTLVVKVNSISTTAPRLASISITYTLCSTNAECDDGNACNGLETCSAGQCVPGTPVSCNDGIYCNGIETCNPSTGQCQAGSSVVCDDGNTCNGLETCDVIQDKCVSGTPLFPCCGNGVCETGESCTSCASDCISGIVPGTVCGNGKCEDGEDCYSCSADCASQLGGKTTSRYCCGGGPLGSTGLYGKTCSFASCGGSSVCISTPAPAPTSYCCGDGQCNGAETTANCSIDSCSVPIPAPVPAPVPAPIPVPVPAPAPAPTSCKITNARCIANNECCTNVCRSNGRCS